MIIVQDMTSSTVAFKNARRVKHYCTFAISLIFIHDVGDHIKQLNLKMGRTYE